jgi:phosphoribosyl 1,2-cyclic phosphodiesterase
LLRFASLASGSGGNCLVVEAGDSSSVTRVLLDCGLNLRDTEKRLA